MSSSLFGMQSLPIELLQKIGDEVERLNDRKNLRATCTQLGDALKPLVLAEVTLNMYRNHVEAGLSLLRALVNQKEYSNYVRKLHIISLSPFSCPDPDTKKVSYACASTWHLEHDAIREWKTDHSFRQSEEGEEIAAQIILLLGPAVQSLQGLTAIHWDWRLKDSDWALHMIMQSLSTLQHIKEFTFRYIMPANFSDTFPPIPAPTLPHLEVLSVSVSTGVTIINLRDVMDPFVQHLMLSTSALHTLHLDTGNWGWRCRALPLETMNKLVPSDITHLNLTGWQWGFHDWPETLSKFTNLHSLELCRIPYLTGNHPYLFEIFRTTGINLRRIATDNISDSLLDYIESYSGLESLSFKSSPMAYGRVNPFHPARFFQNVLPLHRDTLVNLEIQPAFEGAWCFSEENAQSFALCHQLRHLSVRVRCRGMKRYDLKQLLLLKESTPNIIHLLLNTINSSLPHLQRLDLDFARKISHAAYNMFRTRVHPVCCICNQRRSVSCSAVGYCHLVRKLIRGSFVERSSWRKGGKKEAFDPNVLSWVKVYVGGERLVV